MCSNDRNGWWCLWSWGCVYISGSFGSCCANCLHFFGLVLMGWKAVFTLLHRVQDSNILFYSHFLSSPLWTDILINWVDLLSCRCSKLISTLGVQQCYLHHSCIGFVPDVRQSPKTSRATWSLKRDIVSIASRWSCHGDKTSRPMAVKVISVLLRREKGETSVLGWIPFHPLPPPLSPPPSFCATPTPCTQFQRSRTKGFWVWRSFRINNSGLSFESTWNIWDTCKKLLSEH